MCWKQLTLCLLTASFATGQFAAAQGPTDFQGLTASPMFQTWITPDRFLPGKRTGRHECE